MVAAIAAIPVVIAGVYLVSHGSFLGGDVRREQRAATILTEEIIDLTGRTNKLIESVNLSDLRGDAAQARSLIEEARRNNSEAFQKAVMLAKELENLTKAIPEISSPAAQRTAYELVALESALIGEFISYTGDLNRFLNALSAAVATNNFTDRSLAEKNLTAVNQRITALKRITEEFGKKAGNLR